MSVVSTALKAKYLQANHFYNQDMKIKYINMLSSNYHAKLAALFTRIAPIETALHKDVFEMNEDEIKLLFADMIDYEYIRFTLSLLYQYIKWAAEIEGIRYKRLEALDIDITEGLRRSIFSSPEDMIDKLKCTYPFYDSFSYLYPIAPVTFCFCWLGIDTVELWELRSVQVDIKQKMIFRSGQESISIPDLFYPYIAGYKSATVFTGERGIRYRFSDVGFFVRDVKPVGDLSPDKRVDKYYASRKANTFSSLYYEKTGTEVQYNTKNTVLSGMLYRLWQLERSGKEITPAFIRQYYHLASDNATQIHFKLKQFESYKKAFKKK